MSRIKLLNNDRILLSRSDAHKLFEPDFDKILKDIIKINPKSHLDVIEYLKLDFKVVEGGNFGGALDYQNNTIILNKFGGDSEYAQSVISHELSHAIQFKTDFGRFWPEGKLLSDKLHFEQQCESIAEVLHPIIFKTKYDGSYFTIEDFEYLSDYLGDSVENDLFIKV